ncbi:hypothetical protein DFH07DRAFT_859910 [Mycena maculata]|uniref:Mediator of RNA polymerase II transcription subunit 21 n=1 Tax=Mycena maculata TaxID=230809 RepID=A0AAD7MJ68_9AGAR|nr:hypothetical protein DFH07DRAFT_859910 [Mycena maculata]
MLQELSHMDRITQLPDGTQQLLTIMSRTITYLARQFHPMNKKELVTDVIVKAKQVEYLIKSLPEPEREEEQAKRLRALDEEMTVANDAYIQAVARSKDLHVQITDVLRLIPETDTGLVDMLH